MSKKPIYFDDRERDLMRRVLLFARKTCEARIKYAGEPETLALSWMVVEVDGLRIKFEEPSP